MPVQAIARKACALPSGPGKRFIMFQEIQPLKRRTRASEQCSVGASFDVAAIACSPAEELVVPRYGRSTRNYHRSHLLWLPRPTVYVSESKFVVRSPDKPAVSGLGVVLKSAGFANAGDEIYAAQSFASSRDALKALNRNRDFEKAYTRPEISIVDRFNPLGASGAFESLYKYFLTKVALQTIHPRRSRR